MTRGKEPKYYQKSKPQHRYQEYSQSETSLASMWEYPDDPKKKKRVKFEEEYDYSSRDNFYGGRKTNEYDYPYLYDSSNMYETGNNIYDYDTEESRYTHYHQPPQQIMYTGTDSAYTTLDSDMEKGGFSYQPKYKHNYSNSYNKKNKISTDVSDFEANSFGGDLSIYFARQPSSYQTFRHKEPRQDTTSQSEPELQGGTVTETDEETDYTTDGNQEEIKKEKQSNYQIYTTEVVENENTGAFKKELPKNSQERLISITDYDNIPLLAFKNKNMQVSPQNSMSGVVYLPVIVMQNENELPTSKNSKTQLASCKKCEVAERPIESIQVYAATNTGQKSIFERTSMGNYDNTQDSNKTDNNKQKKSSVLNTGNSVYNPNRTSKNVHRASNSKPVSNERKASYVNLTSILRMPGAQKSKLSIKRSFSKPEQNKFNQNQTIKNRSSTTSVTSTKSTPRAENNKKGKNTSRISRKEEKDSKAKKSNTFRGSEGKRSVSRTKSNTSNLSQKCSKIINKISCNKKQSQTQSGRHLIGEDLMGSEKGSSFFREAHQKELEARKEEKIRKSKIASGKQDMIETDFNNTSKVSKRPGRSQSNVYRKSKASSKDNNSDELDLISAILTESEHENLRKNVNKKSISKLQQPSVAVLETNTNNKKSEAGIKPKSFKEENEKNKGYEQKMSDGSQTSLTKGSTAKISPTKSLVKNQDNKKLTELVKEEENYLKSISSNPNKSVLDNRKSLPSESIAVRATKVSPQRSVVQSKNSNIIIQQDKVEEIKLKDQPSDLNRQAQDNIKSLMKESSTVGEMKPSSKKSNLKSQVSNAQMEQDKTEEMKLKSQFLDLNQTVPSRRTSLVTESRKVGETSLQKSMVKTQSTMLKDDQNQLKGGEKNQSQIAEGIKIISQRNSRANEYQSTEKVNEDRKKSDVKETTGVRDKSISVAQRSQHIGSTVGERKSKISEFPDNNLVEQTGTKKNGEKSTTTSLNQNVTKEKDNIRGSTVSLKIGAGFGDDINKKSVAQVNKDSQSFVGRRKSIISESAQPDKKSRLSIGFRALQKEDSMTKKENNQDYEEHSTVQERQVSKINQPNQGYIQQTTVQERQASKVTLKNQGYNQQTTVQERQASNVTQKNQDYNQPTTVQERQVSKVNGNTDQKSINKNTAYIPVGDRKQTVQNSKDQEGNSIIKVQREISSVNKDTNKATGKSSTNKATEKNSIVSNTQNVSKRISHKKESSSVKTAPKGTKKGIMEYFGEYPVKLWGYDCSNLVTFCFQIAQFILGVSAYDKLIEVVENFN